MSDHTDAMDAWAQAGRNRAALTHLMAVAHQPTEWAGAVKVVCDALNETQGRMMRLVLKLDPAGTAHALMHTPGEPEPPQEPEPPDPEPGYGIDSRTETADMCAKPEDTRDE